jgi:hypothetical protein
LHFAPGAAGHINADLALEQRPERTLSVAIGSDQIGAGDLCFDLARPTLTGLQL